MSDRLHHLDALRAFAMLLGIVLHAALAYTGGPWIVRDAEVGGFGLMVAAIHGFRMQLFFLLAGYFTALLHRRLGLAGMLGNRALRIGVPLVAGLATIVPLVWLVVVWSGTKGPAPAPAPAPDAAAPARWQVVLWMLFRFPLFHHLWFLWFLVWMVAGFALVVRACPRAAATRFSGWIAAPDSSARRLVGSGWALAWLVPLGVVSFAMMAPTREGPGFGADTSTALVPLPGVFAHYAAFFAFGALLHEAPDGLVRFSRRWIVAAVGAAILLPVGLAFAYDAPLAQAIAPAKATRALISWTVQPLYAWLASIALLGAFARIHGRERRSVRFVADSAYWLYLAHLPLVLAGQVALVGVPWPPFAKFAVLLSGSTLLLLASYRWCVRYTVVGRVLNGSRGRR